MTIYLDDKRQFLVDLYGKLQHLVAAVPLLTIGLKNLTDEAERPMAAIEVSVAVTLFLAFFYELRIRHIHLRNADGEHVHPHPAVGWFDLAAGVLLIFEVVHGVHLKPVYERAPFYAGLAALAIGLFHGRLHHFRQQRQYIKLSNVGVEVRFNRLRRFSLSWDDLSRVKVDGNRATFQQKDGKTHTFRLSRFRNGNELRKRILEYSGAYVKPV